MKNILFGFFGLIFLLPSISFAQSAADQQSEVYYEQQAAARLAYQKANPQVVAQQDAASRTFYAQQVAARQAYQKANPQAVAQQDAASRAFYTAQVQARLNNLKNNPNTSNTTFTPPSNTPPTNTPPANTKTPVTTNGAANTTDTNNLNP